MSESILHVSELLAILAKNPVGPTNAKVDSIDSGTYWFARAVEAAVVAKMERRLTCDWGKPCIAIERAEHQARERERAAWDAHLLWSATNAYGTRIYLSEEERNRRYPLPAERCSQCGQEVHPK